MAIALNLDLGLRVWWPSGLAHQAAPEADAVPGRPASVSDLLRDVLSRLTAR